MVDDASLLIEDLKSYAKPEKAKHMAVFFKTGEGQYAQGDIFWGLTAPEMRSIVKKYYKTIDFDEIQKLLDSPIHEQRSAGLLCLVSKFEKSKDPQEQDFITHFYLKNTSRINNWDLVDITSPNILGAWAYHNNDVSHNWILAKSGNLWEERISVVSTIYLIRQNNFETTIKLAEHFLSHKHDLMHKAVGWMLREVGKRNEKVLTDFLDKYYQKMPRTMLRYSIERLSLEQKRFYMQK